MLAVVILSMAPLRAAAQNDASALPVVTKFDCPQYPQKAREAHVAGVVIMRITTDGHAVSDVKIMRGAQILQPFAEANVRTWKFADHPPTTFTVTYVYTYDGNYKKDPVTKCAAKMELPEKVTVSTESPLFTGHR
jgi:outer membrane biosynthesis protein TonB